MWRLQHGESPAGSGAKIIVLLIGANDLVMAAREVRRFAMKPHLRPAWWI